MPRGRPRLYPPGTEYARWAARRRGWQRDNRCGHCGGEVVNGGAHCDACLAKQRTRQRAYNERKAQTLLATIEPNALTQPAVQEDWTFDHRHAALLLVSGVRQRAFNALERAGIGRGREYSVAEVRALSDRELLRIRNLGVGSVHNLRNVLGRKNEEPLLIDCEHCLSYTSPTLDVSAWKDVAEGLPEVTYQWLRDEPVAGEAWSAVQQLPRKHLAELARALTALAERSSER